MDVIEQIGSYAGLASIVGLAVLSALYFSQARDVKRLREWAGRAPERAEQAVQQQAPVPQRVVAQPQPKPAPPVPGAAPAPATGARPAPAQVPEGEPAVAAAAATGARPATVTAATGATGNKSGSPVPASAPAKEPAPVPAAAGANKAPVPAGAGANRSGSGVLPATPAATGAAPGAPPAEGAPSVPSPDTRPPGAAPAGTPPGAPTPPQAAVKSPSPPGPAPQAPPAPSTGGGAPPQQVPGGPPAPSPAPRPATPAGQARPKPAPGPPSRAAAAPRLSPEKTVVIPPPRRGRFSVNPRYAMLTVAGVLIVGGGAAFGVAQLIGGDEETPSQQASDGRARDSQENRRTPRPVNPADVTVAVLNGTTVPGLAAGLGDEVERFGFELGTVDNALNQQSAESRVLYAPGHEREAVAVGRRLRIPQREAIDPGSQSRAGDATVVVIAGADQTP